MRFHPLQLSRRSSSLGVIVDSHLPHLICMDDDILSTGVVMYYLKVCSFTPFCSYLPNTSVRGLCIIYFSSEIYNLQLGIAGVRRKAMQLPDNITKCTILKLYEHV